MKYIDQFLKKLNTNRNTFATYLLTLLTAYLVVDRVVEMLLMIFTGVSYSYWGPIQYTLALACPCFAFAFSPKSKFAKNKAYKVSFCHSRVVFNIRRISAYDSMAKHGSVVILIIHS